MTMTRSFGLLSGDDSGHDDGRAPIVLLPGLTFDRHSWAPVTRAVRERDPDRRVVALDLPGHGDSPPQPPHDLPHVAEILHGALDAAGVRPPLLVGHSMSGALASLYGERFPTSGVVNVDQPPVIAAFAQLVRSLEPELTGADFNRVWRDVFAASFHTKLLPAQARRLVEENSAPSQELVLSYWRLILDQPADVVQALIDASMSHIEQRKVPYLLLLGTEAPPTLLSLLRARVPSAEVVVWPGTGHFPHLARPREFADLLLRR
jgi:pimeloyl-ACP methyl ester carboxylesterase